MGRASRGKWERRAARRAPPAEQVREVIPAYLNGVLLGGVTRVEIRNDGIYAQLSEEARAAVRPLEKRVSPQFVRR